MKSKGERERYTQLNAEFQRLARRDKKACFSMHKIASPMTLPPASQGFVESLPRCANAGPCDQ